MDTGVRDLEGSCFKANSTWINDIGSKDLSNRPTYAVLNTHNLESKSVIRLVFKTSSVSPDFFYVFNLILSFSTCSQSFKKSVRGNFWVQTSLSN